MSLAKSSAHKFAEKSKERDNMFALCYIVSFLATILLIASGVYSATSWEEYKKTVESKDLIKSIVAAIICAACIALLALYVINSREMGIWIQ